jgi:transposase InsO family protein
MGRTGDRYDNALTESFSSAGEREWARHESDAAREGDRRSSFESIGVFTNRRRLHSALGCRSPAESELRFAS